MFHHGFQYFLHFLSSLSHPQARVPLLETNTLLLFLNIPPLSVFNICWWKHSLPPPHTRIHILSRSENRNVHLMMFPRRPDINSTRVATTVPTMSSCIVGARRQLSACVFCFFSGRALGEGI